MRVRVNYNVIKSKKSKKIGKTEKQFSKRVDATTHPETMSIYGRVITARGSIAVGTGIKISKHGDRTNICSTQLAGLLCAKQFIFAILENIDSPTTSLYNTGNAIKL
uniref:(northern house mosquito) hypothetical protein n=1 Tax=Culex pipiens TaxID=7175 RepID=A0A8D8GVC4_CULPI